VPRSQLTARQVAQACHLRWLVELLFREVKQAADSGRSFTVDANAVQAMTDGAMLAHVLVSSLRIQAALDNEIPLEQLRPLACLHVARAFARDIIDALAASTRCARVESPTTWGSPSLSSLASSDVPSYVNESRLNSRRLALKRSAMRRDFIGVAAPFKYRIGISARVFVAAVAVWRIGADRIRPRRRAGAEESRAGSFIAANAPPLFVVERT